MLSEKGAQNLFNQINTMWIYLVDLAPQKS